MRNRFALVAWAVATVPTAFVKTSVAFTSINVDRRSFIAYTDRKTRVWSRSSQRRTTRTCTRSASFRSPHHDQNDLIDRQPHFQTRKELLRSWVEALATVAFIVTTSGGSPVASGASEMPVTGKEPEITSKCFVEVRIMEPLNEANGYSSKNAFRGRLVFGLYGRACPKAVENFLRYAGSRPMSGEPSYSEGLLTKMEPGVLLEGGKISGLNIISIGGQEELEYNGEVIPMPTLLENASVELLHDRRGLLTRERLSKGPEFGVTLAPARDLDGSHEVFGRLLQGDEVLSRLEKVPVYSGGSRLLEEGSVASNAFKAQNRALVYIGKNVFKDERAVDRTGSLMRRVDIVNCGVL